MGLRSGSLYFTAALVAVFCLRAAQAQSIVQGGPSVSGHAPMYQLGPGQGFAAVMDSGYASGLSAAGTQTGAGLSELLQVNHAAGTGPFSTHVSFHDNPIGTQGGYHALSFDANALGGGLITYDALAGAPPKPLQICTNGDCTTFPIPTGSPCNANAQGLLPATGGGSVNILRADCTFTKSLADAQTAAMVKDDWSFEVTSQPGLSAKTVYQMVTNASPGPQNYDGIRSVVTATLSGASSVTNMSAISGYIVNDNPANGLGPSVNNGNAVGLFGIAVSAVNGADSWGGNVICADSTVYGLSGGSGRGCHGFEIDVNLSNPTTIGQGLLIAGASTAVPCSPGCAFPAIQIIQLGTNIPWAAAVVSNPGATSQGFNFGAVGLPGPNVNGVDNFLNYYDASSRPQYWDVVVQAGNLNITNSASPPNTNQLNNFMVIEAGLAVGANGAANNSPSNPIYFNFINSAGVGRNYDIYVDNAGVLQLDGNGGSNGRFNTLYQLSTTNNFFPAQALVSQLPACASSIKGAIWQVTDQSAAPSFRGPLTGGGSIMTLAMCNGSTWEAH